jgi:hypothetical protein
MADGLMRAVEGNWVFQLSVELWIATVATEMAGCVRS